MDGKADMSLASLSITEERSQVIDFSVPFLETGITIIVAVRDGVISATAFLGTAACAHAHAFAHTHAHTHSLTLSFTYSFTHSLAHSHRHPHSLTLRLARAPDY